MALTSGCSNLKSAAFAHHGESWGYETLLAQSTLGGRWQMQFYYGRTRAASTTDDSEVRLATLDQFHEARPRDDSAYCFRKDA